MKTLITLFLISVLAIGCKEGGGGSSSQGNLGWGNQIIADDPSQLGELAQYIVANDQKLIKDTYNKNSSDLGVFYALRALVNTQIKAVDGNGLYDIDNNSPMQAWLDLTGQTSNVKGVDSYGLSVVMADVYESFGLQTKIAYMSGTPTANFPDGKHHCVEVFVDGEWVAVDPKLNTMFTGSGAQSINQFYMSVDEVGAALQNDVMSILRNPTGYQYVSGARADSWFEFYEDSNLHLESQRIELRDNVWKNTSYLDYSAVRN